MKRLLWKELREARGYGALLLATLVILAALRHPLAFRQQTIADVWILFPLFAAFLMGLSAYARENAAETLPFALSRPVRWWWIVLAKVGAGALICLACAAAAAVVYLAVLPAVYRPFLEAAEILRGIGRLGGGLIVSFAIGMAFSPLARGTVAALIASILIGFSLSSLGDLAMDIHNRPVLNYISAVALGLAALLSVMSPAVLDARRRVGRWAGVVGAGVLILFASAAALRSSGAEPRPPHRYGDTPGPGGLVAYAPFWMEASTPNDVWVRTLEGRYVRIIRADDVAVLAWTPDGRLLFVSLEGDRAILQLAGQDTGWKPAPVALLPKLPQGHGPYFESFGISSAQVKWSPDGKRLAIGFDAPSGTALIGADIDTGAARFLSRTPASGAVWWQDSNRLVVVDQQRVRVHSW